MGKEERSNDLLIKWEVRVLLDEFLDTSTQALNALFQKRSNWLQKLGEFLIVLAYELL